MYNRISIRWLADRLGCADKHNELKKALTHKSFFKEEDSEQSNSRYVFVGMFGFKGKVADTLFNYMPGTGTQLQHYLGNLFKDEILLKIYDAYYLGELCRYGNDFNIAKQKHIVVYGFLGFVCKWLSPEKLDQFITRNFLAGTNHLMPTQFRNCDLQSQCNYFSRIRHQKNVSVTTQRIDEFLFRTAITAGNELIHEAESKSYRYSRKKALKQALLILSAPERVKLDNDAEYQQRETERLQKEISEALRLKKKKQDAYLEKKEKIQKQKREEREKAKTLAAEREIERKKAKARAKARIEARKKLEENKKSSVLTMSVAKRRHLEDKKK
ncbi:MAG TPA: hypothetical protein PLB87_07425 [Prolixibacteraceae bacterium]|nr:hypothetical protein [Prolixibacteraceae bacterium]